MQDARTKTQESDPLTPDQIREQIAEETGVSLEQQAEYCFEMAYHWLEHALGTDPHGMEILPLTPGFWPWWCTYWNAVDRAFITSRVTGLGNHQFIQLPGSSIYRMMRSKLQVLDIWESYHDTQHVHGNQAILERGFHQYIKELVSKS